MLVSLTKRLHGTIVKSEVPANIGKVVATVEGKFQ